MATKRGSKAKRSRPPAKKKPKAKRPRKIALQGRITTALHAAAKPLSLKTARGGASAGTAPMHAVSNINIVPPEGELNIQGAVGIAEGADAVDAVGAVVVTRKANLLKKIDELRALIEEVFPVADAFDEKRATIGHNNPPREYAPDTSGLPALARSDLDDAILSLNIIRDQVATDRAPDTDADTLARRTVDRVFKLIGGALRWLGNLANRVAVETLAKKIAEVDPQTWINLAEKAWDTFSGFLDLL